MSDSARQALLARLRNIANNRCGYCLSPQHLVLGPLEVDHLIPSSLGGSDNESNSWLACRMCNNFKAAQISALDPQTNQIVKLYDPRRQVWGEHFDWTSDGKRIQGLPATVLALQLNHFIALTVRENWIAVGWHPPST